MNNPTTPQHNSSTRRIIRDTITEHGQYEINRIIEINGLQPRYPVYDLQIRGHTSLIVGDTPDTPTTELHQLELRFSPVAVHDIGVKLLRASHIIIPLTGITVLEDSVDTPYTDTRRIENPLNNSTALTETPLAYPNTPEEPV